ncbi:MAG: hypothetical protein JRE19_10085 [Deltaproteobacteria bacterium]|nr:hypothetical protein [Deltaproteobacteria bacterium]
MSNVVVAVIAFRITAVRTKKALAAVLRHAKARSMTADTNPYSSQQLERERCEREVRPVAHRLYESADSK